MRQKGGLDVQIVQYNRLLLTKTDTRGDYYEKIVTCCFVVCVFDVYVVCCV